MFTGIVRHVGHVKSVRPGPGASRLVIDVGPLAAGLGLGDSVAVNGACLTAAELSIRGSVVGFDAIGETLSRTTLGSLRPGGKVNLERALSAGDALDGHMVQGHVDATATVRTVGRGDGAVIEFAGPAELLAQIVPKGSVAVDGVSLTVVKADKQHFSVALIPTTLAETTLKNLSPGDEVNVETDVIGKYVLRYLEQMAGGGGGGLSLDSLRRAGFL